MTEQPIDVIPEQFGWTLTHLIRLSGGDWQANISNDDAVVVGVGLGVTGAVWGALNKAGDEVNHKQKWRPLMPTPASNKPTLADLGLVRERQLLRRF